MDGGPLVTVIVPVYNAEKYLARCLDSIVKQTYPNLEILLIDDGSTDGSRSICRRYMCTDPRIRLFCQENQGQSAARNLGLSHMRGEYLTFVDADDYIAPFFIQLLLEQLLERGAALAVCGFDTPGEEEPVRTERYPQGALPCRMLSRDQVYDSLRSWRTSSCFVVIWGALYVKDIFKTLRFPAGMICEDECIFHQIYDQTDEVCYIDLELYHYVQSSDSTMRRNGRYQMHREAAEALMQRLKYFQDYGKKKYVRMTAAQILSCTKTLYEDSGAGERQVQRRLREALDEIQQVTGRRIYSFACILYLLSPPLYRLLKAGCRGGNKKE